MSDTMPRRVRVLLVASVAVIALAIVVSFVLGNLSIPTITNPFAHGLCGVRSWRLRQVSTCSATSGAAPPETANGLDNVDGEVGHGGSR